MRRFELKVDHAVLHLFKVKLKSLKEVDTLEDVDRKFSVDCSFQLLGVFVFKWRRFFPILVTFCFQLCIVGHKDFVGDW